MSRKFSSIFANLQVEESPVPYFNLKVGRPANTMSPIDVISAVEQKQVDGWVILKGKLFYGVKCGSEHELHTGLQHHNPGEANIFGDPIPPDCWPTHPFEISAPPRNVKEVGALVAAIKMIKDLHDDIAMAIHSKGLDLDKPIVFIQCGGRLSTLIKLYTDSSWIAEGWGGPAIVVPPPGDARFRSVVGVLPSSDKVVTLRDVVDEIDELFTLAREYSGMYHPAAEYMEVRRNFLSFIGTYKLN